MSSRRTIRTDYLARVEGEGAMSVRLVDGHVEDVELRIFEPPRFFEALLRGRSFREPPDITARICGICPVAYQTSAVNAIEDACGVDIPEPIRALRRLLYCGEWIESHALHVYMLHAPDFLGYDGAVQMAREHPREVERGLALKKTGNEILALIGGREIHPINVRVGGFYRAPKHAELRTLVDPLERAREAALETVRWTAGFPFPEREVPCELVALTEPGSYAIEDGRIASDRGLKIAAAQYDEHFTEEHVERSNALHSRRTDGGVYLCGPLARYTLNGAGLSALAREAANDAGLEEECRDAFRSIVVRGVELVYACDEALRLIDTYEEPDAAAVEFEPRRGTARAALPPVHARGRRNDRRREDRAADLPEPARDRGGSERRRDCTFRPWRRRAAEPVRTSHPQLRPLHLLRHALPDTRRGARVTQVVIIGVGNAFRGDDAAGIAVAERIRANAPKGVTVRVCEEEPTRLLDAFGDADVAIIVDAVSTGAAPGTLHRFDASDASVSSRELRSSTHAVGIGETIELARALERLPRRTIVFGIEGSEFVAREGLSAAVADGVARASAHVLEEVAACMSKP